MHAYHQKSIMWADAALVNHDNGHPFSHACPAKDLSVVMVVEFLRAWLRRGGQDCWAADLAPSDISINGYTATTFTLTEVCVNAPPSPPCTGADSTDACPQSAMASRQVACESALDAGAMRIGGGALPEALRGVFWLTDQGDSSALMSFAQSNDGGGYSTGVVTPTSGGGRIEVRVGGDRVWSFSDDASSAMLVDVLGAPLSKLPLPHAAAPRPRGLCTPPPPLSRAASRRAAPRAASQTWSTTSTSTTRSSRRGHRSRLWRPTSLASSSPPTGSSTFRCSWRATPRPQPTV